MYCRKRNEPDGLHLPSSMVPKRLMYMQQLEAQLSSSLDSERTFFVQKRFATSHADAGHSSTADSKYVVTGKRSCTCAWRTGDAEDCSKRSRVEYSDVTESGVTFQKDSTLHQARKPEVESDAASVSRRVGSRDEPERLNLGEICCNETDVDEHGLCAETDPDEHRMFIRSRVQESRGNMLSVARQCVRGTAASSVSWCGESRDGSHGNTINTLFRSRLSDASKPSLIHLGKAKAGDRLVYSKHLVTSPQITSEQSQHAPLINTDTLQTKDSLPSYVLSSGRMSLEQEARLGRRAPTIDDDFEEYFSSLML